MRTKWVLICLSGVILALGIWLGTALFSSPAPPSIQPDSIEAWRVLLQSESRNDQLAAAVLLASKGDAQGTSAVLGALPTLAEAERGYLNECFLYLENKSLLAPKLIDTFLFQGSGVEFIAPGKEKEHVKGLEACLDRQATANRANVVLASSEFWQTVSALVAAGDQEALARCESRVRTLSNRISVLPRHDFWYWAELFLAANRDAPLEGLEKIRKVIAPKFVPRLAPDYIEEMGIRGCFKELIDLWLTLPPDEAVSTDTLHRHWDSEWRKYGPDATARTVVAWMLERRWNQVPADQRARLSEADRDRFFLAFARYCESNIFYRKDVKEPTRESFLRLLEEPRGGLLHHVQARREAGDKDLRELLVHKASVTTDSQQAGDIAYALHYWLGGAPEDINERFRKMAAEPSLDKNDALNKQRTLNSLNAAPPRPTPAPAPPKPYADSWIPWALRNGRVGDALGDVRAVAKAAEAYYVDWSEFPPGLPSLTTPVAYLKLLKPDLCAVSGPYAYTPSPIRYFNYAAASPGPDGVRDISLRHLVLSLDFAARKGARPKTTPYVRRTTKGYEFLDSFLPGADIVVTRF